jgi:TonB family protein
MTRPQVATLLLVIALTSLASSQESPEAYHADDHVMSGLLMKHVSPVYPPLARQARIQGTVILKARINRSGEVTSVQLVRGHPMLAPAAIEAVKQWKYESYMLNGEPVEVETNVAVNFTLSDKPPAPGGDVPDASKAGEPGSASNGENAADQASAHRLATPQRIRVSSGVARGLLVSKVNPMYPPDARDQRIQGVVLLQATIDKEGNVASLQLISGHPLLAPAAIEAVKQWKYRPYLLNGNPLEVNTQIQVNFTLTE